MNRAWIELDSQALKHNIAEVSKGLAEGTKLMGVVKANGYGHGAVQMAQKLKEFGFDHFCVATFGEAIELRKAGIDDFIIILGGTNPAYAFEIYENNLVQAIVSEQYAKDLNAAFEESIKYTSVKGAKLRCHLALDTGMHRIGIMGDDIEAMKRVHALPSLQVEGMFTHLPVADTDEEEHVEFTKNQIEMFKNAKAELIKAGINPGIVHCQNSFGTVNYSPVEGMDYARMGVLMYGLLQAYGDYTVRELDLQPVMTIKARIVDVRTIEEGESVGYGRVFRAKRTTKIATVGFGYADGVPRTYSPYFEALVHGKRCHAAGRICMDQLMLDVTDVEDVKPGDIITIIGKEGDEQIKFEDWGEKQGTIAHELSSCMRRIENHGWVK